MSKFFVTTHKGTDIVKADEAEVKDGCLIFVKETRSTKVRGASYKTVTTYNLHHVIKWREM